MDVTLYLETWHLVVAYLLAAYAGMTVACKFFFDRVTDDGDRIAAGFVWCLAPLLTPVVLVVGLFWLVGHLVGRR
jgi:hypothetical protein